MHELSVTQSVVDICLRHAAGRKVLSVTLEIGGLSGIVPEAVEFCFEACSRDTLLDNARLTIVTVQPDGSCRDCGGRFSPRTRFDPCPQCGSYAVELVAGEEMRVKELEVD